MRVEALFDRLFDNEDDTTYKLAQEVLRGEHAWLEKGIMGMPPEWDVAPKRGSDPEPEGERQGTGERETTEIGAGG
jgi:hypothetical protein